MTDLRSFVEKGQRAQAAVDALGAGRPEPWVLAGTIRADQLCGQHLDRQLEIPGYVHPGPRQITEDVTGPLRELLVYDQGVMVWLRGRPIAYVLATETAVVVR